MDLPKVTSTGARTVAGLTTRASPGSTAFESLWREVTRRDGEFDSIADGEAAYGVSTDFDPETGEIEYLAGVAVDDGADVPDDFETVALPAGTCAVVETTVPEMTDDRHYLEGEWLTESDFERAGSPEFERYVAGFDPDDPDTAVEIYLPVVEAEPTAR